VSPQSAFHKARSKASARRTIRHCQVQGTYYDTLIRQGQEWLFQNCRIEVEFLTPLGDVIDRMQPMGFEDGA
jgi:hypothetical protein